MTYAAAENGGLSTPRRKPSDAAIVARLAYYRRIAREAGRAPNTSSRARRAPENGATTDFRIIWAGEIDVLRDCIDLVSDWGPFELVAAHRIGRTAVLCRFDYHGPEEHRRHYTENLAINLRQVAPTEMKPPAESTLA